MLDEIAASAGDPELLFACDLARVDLARAQQRSGERLTEMELASTRELLRGLVERHPERFHPLGQKMGQYAERTLHELEHLAPGMPAPDIEGQDLAGRPLALSSFREQGLYSRGSRSGDGEGGDEFMLRSKRDGLKAAMKWREEKFGNRYHDESD